MFRFGLPHRTRVSLDLFDVAGRHVRALVKGEKAEGWHAIEWRGETDHGSEAGAGVFFARFRADGREFVQRIVWLR
jgi:flagellar hook assembly protein FlgD